MSASRVSYGWIVVGASAVIVCMGLGAMFSLAVFIKPIEETMGWTRSGISTIALINWLAIGIGSFLWGTLSDRVGTRIVVLAGGCLLGLGLVLSSQVGALWQLHATFGVAVGLGAGAFYAPLTSTATKWFVARRGLAVALVSGGIGLGVFTVAPLVRWLTSLYGWRIAMLSLGDLAWVVILPLALLIREEPRLIREEPRPAAAGAPAGADEPDFSTGADAIAPMAAASVLGLSGLVSIAGRVFTGVLADRFGAKRTLVVGLIFQAVMVVTYLVARDLTAFMAIGLLFGLAYGGVMPLYALVTREYFGEKVMGTAYGGIFLVSTLGMGLGSFAGGWFYDHLGAYTWLFLSSAAIGAAAAVLALTFRPPLRAAVAVTAAR
jgi:MFS family permease